MRKRSAGSDTIVMAASGGFLAGAIVMTLGAWGVPTVMRSPNPSGQHPAERPLAADRKEARLSPSSTATPRVEGDPIRELRNRQLDLPVRDAVRRELHNSFDETRRWFHRHEAIDIVAPRGALVLAVEDGTIVRLFESKAGGTTVYQFDPKTKYAYYWRSPRALRRRAARRELRSARAGAGLRRHLGQRA